MLKIKRSEPVEIEIFDIVYKVQKPTYERLERLQAILEDDAGKKGLGATRELLVECGLPSDVIGQMLPDDVRSVLEYISQSKKN